MREGQVVSSPRRREDTARIVAEAGRGRPTNWLLLKNPPLSEASIPRRISREVEKYLRANDSKCVV